MKRHKCRAPVAFLVLLLLATPPVFAKTPFFPDKAPKGAPAATNTAATTTATNTPAEAEPATNEPPPSAESAAAKVELSGPESAFTNRVYAAPQPPPEVKPVASRDDVLFAGVVFLAVGLAVTKFLHRCSQYDPWNPQPDRLVALFHKHCPTFAGFFGALNAEESTPDAQPALALGSIRGHALELDVVASALAVLTGLRARLVEASETFADNPRVELFNQVRKELATINPGGDSAGTRPIWLLVSALDGLLAEVSENAAHLTPSVLRTITSALDVLEGLCVTALDTKLVLDSPVRLLAVDDDPICQRAITFALKKVFPAPDIVPTGEAALALASKNSYDLVFLDLQLPGMDGFQVCSRLHQLPGNQTTPVVFVTHHSDFNSRSEAIFRGGEDLIGKPYLTFEIALKAVTLVFRNRFQSAAPQQTQNQNVECVMENA